MKPLNETFSRRDVDLRRPCALASRVPGWWVERESFGKMASEDCCELLECARYGEDDDMRALLNAGVPVDFSDDSGNTALHKAAANGHVSCIEVLASYGARHLPNASGNLPLHWAVQQGHVSVAKTILRLYADVDVLEQNSFGRSISTEAFAVGNAEMVELLLQHSSAQKLEPEAQMSISAVRQNGETIELWSGPSSQLQREGAAFSRINFGGKSYVYKPAYGAPACGWHRPLGVHKVNTTLGLQAYAGVQQFMFQGKDEDAAAPMFLEAEVAQIPGGRRRDSRKQDQHLLYDVLAGELACKGECATSLSDLTLPFDKKTLRHMHISSLQRLALLCLVSRCEMLNLDDVLLCESQSIPDARGAFTLLLGDATKAFNFEHNSGVSVFDDEQRLKRKAGPLDELTEVYGAPQPCVRTRDQWSRPAPAFYGYVNSSLPCV